MAGKLIVIDYNHMNKEELHRLADIGVRDVLLQEFPQWSDLEPSEGKFNWTQLDDYVDSCNELQIKPIIRLNNVPSWVDPKLSTRSCQHWESTPAMLSPWSVEAAELLKDRLKLIHNRYSSVDVTVNPPQPLAEYWLIHSYTEACQCGNKDSLWRHDQNAKLSFETYLMDRGLPKKTFVTGTEPINQENAEDMADTLGWLWHSLGSFWRDIYKYCSELGQDELWAALVPRMAFCQSHIDVGLFDMEAWIEQLRQELQPRTSLNMLFYSAFTCGPEHYFYYIYLLRRHAWRAWVGAEGVVGLAHNSCRAAKLGFEGVVVASPKSLAAESDSGSDWGGVVDAEYALACMRNVIEDL